MTLKIEIEPSRNSKVLSDFVQYLVEHPDQRFWQGLRNWSDYAYVFGSNSHEPTDFIDTFYKEGK